MVRTKVLKHLPGARKDKRGGGKEDVRRGVTARGAMEISGCVRVIEGKIGGNDSVKYLFPAGVGSTS